VKDRLKDSPFRLSGGQQQLLCLARALAINRGAAAGPADLGAPPDRTIFLNQGPMVEHGDTKQVFEHRRTTVARIRVRVV
jgi:ABC-type phosphate transport system ATPase subunit